MSIDCNNYHKITVAEMAPHIHTFLPSENKAEKLFYWLENWIIQSLDCRKIKPFDFLPSKAELAYHLGVSQGTVQNVYRLLEDKGYVESKQRIGTYIKCFKEHIRTEKLTSKRELAIETVKKYLVDNEYKNGDFLISTRRIAKKTKLPNTTVRTAIQHLVIEGILIKQKNNFIIHNMDYKLKNIQIKTLVEKISDELRQYIITNYKQGDRLPSNSELKKFFNVSIKTMHDAVKLLSKEGLVCTRRGRYGTIVNFENNDSTKHVYAYEKIEQKVRQYIIKNCQVGEKLPSIKRFSQMYNTSEKTVKKALDNLGEDGFITFVRGRYGGTFVLDIPEENAQAYKWLAINTDYIS